MKFPVTIFLFILYQSVFASDECLNILKKDKKLDHLAFEFEKTGEMNNGTHFRFSKIFSANEGKIVRYTDP